MDSWLRDNLSSCLDCVVTDDMLKTILAIKDDNAFDNYFGNLLNKDYEPHRLFLSNCRRMLLNGEHLKSTYPSKYKAIKVGKATQTATATTTAISGSSSSTAISGFGGGGGGTKKKTKYVNLYTQDGKVIGDTILLKGRRLCDCQAAQHRLVNNCLQCGRIVCGQEGNGPCLFCGAPVYTVEEEQNMLKASKSATKVKSPKTINNKFENNVQEAAQSDETSLKEALIQRDRLLEYDRNSEKRTTVIDDEFDYFQENSVWLNDAEREKFERLKQEMHDLKHGSRIKRKIKVDFAGREVPEELPISKDYEEQVLREITDTASASNSNWSKGGDQNGSSILMLAPNLNVAQPLYKPSGKDVKKNPSSHIVKSDNLERIYNRVQDKELMEMQDMRQCLSMHQPWASLLVAGIKMHEGRVWYSEHRGRLWIASTAKEPREEDIAELEQFYLEHLKGANIRFPNHYPTGSLLGCVNVENCLPQEEYRDVYPDGESDSPYVFICTHPEQLPVMLPVHGEHKIYELPYKTHNTACKMLLRAHSTKG